MTATDTDDAHLIDVAREERSMKFNITAGVIERMKMASFEKLLWRVSKGEMKKPFWIEFGL